MKHEAFFDNYNNSILATSKIRIWNPKVVMFGLTLGGRIYMHVHCSLG
jgi:hypothetical protein